MHTKKKPREKEELMLLSSLSADSPAEIQSESPLKILDLTRFKSWGINYPNEGNNGAIRAKC